MLPNPLMSLVDWAQAGQTVIQISHLGEAHQKDRELTNGRALKATVMLCLCHFLVTWGPRRLNTQHLLFVASSTQLLNSTFTSCATGLIGPPCSRSGRATSCVDVTSSNL